MTSTDRAVLLQGRLFLTFTITAVTGLHIGGSPGVLSIGNVDNPVIRDPLTSQPYIPGSSLRGKMRSQLEKQYGRPQNNRIGQVTIHTCRSAADYASCNVCKTFGIPGEHAHSETSRLIVRDAKLTETSVALLKSARTDLPFTEVKWEAAIDRVTSAATPRQQERVPAGAEFSGELVFSLYSFDGRERNFEELRLFTNVLEALELVEEDYLGGQGARGSGKVRFADLKLTLKQNSRYGEPRQFASAGNLSDLRSAWEQLLGRMKP
ncbi:MAG TPA: type III-A CRISPR-associated RAMP protein Csm3 [Roseiflexaceae bacterium]|nr:type III-A CRISPR-associated RAMP protein Csm3 [Roseiflexaceae bacterium]